MSISRHLSRQERFRVDGASEPSLVARSGTQEAERTRPVALSLFSGAGGMDLGVSQAGFDILACIEIDCHCCETLRSWVAREGLKTTVIQSDIREIQPLALMTELALEPGALDLLFGGPPCQAFSQIGKRGSLDDERGELLFQMHRFAEVFRPRAIMLEQVKGLLNAPDRVGKPGGTPASVPVSSS